MKLSIVLLLSLFAYSSALAFGAHADQIIAEQQENLQTSNDPKKEIDQLKEQINEIENRTDTCKNSLEFFKLAGYYVSFDQTTVQTEIANCMKLFREKQKLVAELEKYEK
jgi:hypothetical protein